MSKLNSRPGWYCSAPWLSLKHFCFLSFKMVERPIPFLFYCLKNIYLAAMGLSCSTRSSLQRVRCFIAAHRLSDGGMPISSCSESAPEPHGSSGCSVWALKLWCMGSRVCGFSSWLSVGSVAQSQMGSLFSNQRSNPCPLHCKVSS